MHHARWEFGQVGMDGSGRLPAMGRRVNNGFGPVGDIACGEDAWSAGRQRLLVDEQSAPGSHTHTRAFRSEGGIGRFTDSHQYDIDR